MIPLMAVLCSTTGLLIGTAPAYAATHLTAIINGLGGAKSATVLFKGKPLGNPPCVTTPLSRIVGDVTGAGMFSVNFYSTPNCTGTRKQFHQYQLNQGDPGGIAVCNSDTDCFFKVLENTPSKAKDAIVTVLFKSLVNAQSASVIYRDATQFCVTKQQLDQENTQHMFSLPVSGAGMFSVNFYFTPNCTGTRNNFFRFNAQQGSNGVFVTCESETKCECAGFGC